MCRKRRARTGMNGEISCVAWDVVDARDFGFARDCPCVDLHRVFLTAFPGLASQLRVRCKSARSCRGVGDAGGAPSRVSSEMAFGAIPDPGV